MISPLISIEANATSEPAATRAYRALEHMIVTLELAPSSFVTEGALIDRLGLGRTPVREAIQRLAWEGLLDIRPRAGIAVAPLHAGDWLRVLDARRGIEVVLARSAARFVTREAADLFHEAALAMQKAVISGNVLAFIQADKALQHLDIAETRFQAKMLCDHVAPMLKAEQREAFGRVVFLIFQLAGGVVRLALTQDREEGRRTIEDYRSIIHTQLRQFL